MRKKCGLRIADCGFADGNAPAAFTVNPQSSILNPQSRREGRTCS